MAARFDREEFWADVNSCGAAVLPFVGALRNASRAPLRWSYGLIEEGGRRMYVTSGLGTSGIPLRIGMPPEYAIIDVGGGP